MHKCYQHGYLRTRKSKVFKTLHFLVLMHITLLPLNRYSEPYHIFAMKEEEIQDNLAGYHVKRYFSIELSCLHSV